MLLSRCLPALSLLVSLSLGCGDQTLDTSDTVGATSEPVIGGTPATACGWPSTVLVTVNNGACTGTLIHPRVVTTAAHCLSGTDATITFGGLRGTTGAFSLMGKCKAGAKGSAGVNTGNDWGYCVLPEDARVKQVQITPPLVGCEAQRFLKAGAHAWVVGFGQTSAFGGGSGMKNQVEVLVNALDKLAPGTVDVGDAQVGACHGDSGGPIYLHLMDGGKDWGFRVFGSTSGPGSGGLCDCTCSTTYVNISNHVKQIEKNEGIDVTPCTDAEGKWAPGADCKALPKDPQHAMGTFPACNVTLTSDPIETCDAQLSGSAGGGAGVAGFAGNAGRGGAGTAGTGGAAGSGGLSGGGAGGTTLPSAGLSGSPGIISLSAGSNASPFNTTAGMPAAPVVQGVAGIPAYQPAPQVAGCQCNTLGVSSRQSARPWLLAPFALCGWLFTRKRRAR